MKLSCQVFWDLCFQILAFIRIRWKAALIKFGGSLIMTIAVVDCLFLFAGLYTM
jgi:hypothetical protein